MTDLVHKVRPTARLHVVVLEQLPDNIKFDREAREQLLDVFRDTADYWADRKVSSDASILFSSPLPKKTG